MIDNTLLTKQDQKTYNGLLQECNDSWTKRQVYRTETEMRLSVLNEMKHPTPAAKYWQSVREQSVFFENLMTLSFDYRRKLIELEKKKKELNQEENELEKALLQIDIDEIEWIIKSQKLDAHHRIRELEHWSRIKEELNDGSFDITNPDTHQMKSLAKRFENDYNSLSPGSSVSEVRNAVGLHHTAQKHTKQLEAAK